MKSGTVDAVSDATSGMGSTGSGIVSALVGGGVNFATDKLKDAQSKKDEKRLQKDTKIQKAEQDKQVKQAVTAEKKKADTIEGLDKGITVSKEVEAFAQQNIQRLTAQSEVATSQIATEQITADNEKKAVTGMWGNLGRAVSEAWAQGGPYLGPALAAGVTAAVGALMTWVMNMMGHSSRGAASSTINTKLVSGMLTYDAGNVQSFLVPAYDDGVMPVMADNGKVYMAQPAGQLGTGMVTRPTLTTIGGMPALVGEEGPEMVIGRETTRALQMNNPEILRIIQAYDVRHSRGYAKAYDSGNVSEVMGAPGAGTANESAAQMQQTLMMLNNTLAELQQKGIHATINKYGRGGLVDEVTSGIEETRRVGSSNRVNRLFR